METEKAKKADPESPAPGEAEVEGREASSGGERGEASAAVPAESGDLAAVHQKLLAEKGALYDRLLRKQAELENLRKRTQREKEEFAQHATFDLVRALLPVLDGFERALKHPDESIPEQFYQGMELIYRQLLGALTRAGLTPTETAGKTFDPHLHQAVETIEAPAHEDQQIVEELQRGYRLKHRLLRPAIVKVAVSSRKETAKPTSERITPAD